MAGKRAGDSRQCECSFSGGLATGMKKGCEFRMQKQMGNKMIIICAAAAAVLIAAAVTALFLFRDDEAFRSIMVYELEGSAVIDRAKIGTIDAAENLYLESGDRVSVAQKSMMRMKLDDDKYVTAEADTVFALEAEGDGGNSRTRIRLEQGAVTNEIQKPLGGGDLYETTTPNSVMAVRGTIYRAELYDDGAGGQDMRLCCFDGTVAAKPVLPDGTYGEEVLVHAGSEVTVYSDGTMTDVKEIDFESLPEQSLETLSGLMESGAPVTGISAEELSSFIADSTDDSEEAVMAEADESDSQSESDTTEASVEDTKAEEDEALQEEGRDDVDQQKLTAGRDKEKTGQSKGGSTKKPDSGKDSKPADDKDTGKDGTPAAGSSDNGNTSSGGSGSGNSGNNGSGDSDKPSEEGKPGDDDQDKKPGGDSGSKPNPPAEKIYTVTFEYQGTVFATQNVKSGRKVSVPVLAPAAAGSWDFDFDKKIKADTTIQWKP